MHMHFFLTGMLTAFTLSFNKAMTLLETMRG